MLATAMITTRNSSPDSTERVFHARYPQTPSLENMPQFYTMLIVKDFVTVLACAAATTIFSATIIVGVPYIVEQLAGK
jgi:hypothetical protein